MSLGPIKSTGFSLPPLAREFIVGGVLLAAVVASRHTGINYPAELSADESELLVQVDRYEHDLMPWRSVDGGTVGPVTPWFLLVVKQAGWPMTYRGIHLLGAVLLGLIAVISYYTVRLFLSFPAAGLVGLAGVLVLGCSASINFMYFATELVPALILGLGGFVLIRAQLDRPARLGLLTLAAGCGGLAPWAKLQAAPVGLVLCAFAAWTAWAHVAPGGPWPRRIAAVALVVAGAALPTISILTVVCLGGAFPDFWASFIVANLGYAGSFGVTDAGARLFDLLQRSQLNGLMAGIAALAGYCLVKSRPGQPAAPAPAAGIRPFAAACLAAAVFSCIRPPHGFGHYHIFLIGPLLVAMGALVHRAWPDRAQPDGARGHRGSGLVVALCALVPAGVLSAGHYVDGESLRQHLIEMQRTAGQGVPAVVSREIKRLAPGARTMVVWGWMPALYINAQLPNATRSAVSLFLINPGPSRDFLRRQFLHDVVSTRPEVIVDAVASDCFTWDWPVRSSGIESFPEFAAYVQAHYSLALNLVTDPAGVPLRVFVRKLPDSPHS